VLDEKFRELMRTGLFNVLQINPQPEAGNYLRLDISAEEAKAKEFGFSVGYGTYVGGIVGLSFADRDLFGYGRPLTTSIEISERGYKGEILWDDPHFFESDVELKVRLSAFTFDFDGYSKFEIGARTEFSYNITKQYQVGVFGSERRVEIVSNDIKDKFIGDTKYFVSSIGLFHTLDLRDSPVVPSRGLILGQTFELAANAIGSEIELLRTTARASYFIPIGRTLLEVGARAGLVRPLEESTSDINAIPIDERFLMVAALLCAASANAISGRMITGATRSAGNFIPSSMSNIPSRFTANCRARFFSMPVICCQMPTIPVSVTCAMESVRVYATNYPSVRSGSIMV
jgi:Outer membrane protein/protective antigen OMA87